MEFDNVPKYKNSQTAFEFLDILKTILKNLDTFKNFRFKKKF